MKCPRCGSEQMTSQAITETTSTGKTKGFGWIKSCLGFLLFSVPGILCGLCGMGSDWLIQETGLRESNNYLRLFTGILRGFGLFNLYCLLFKRIFSQKTRHRIDPEHVTF